MKAVAAVLRVSGAQAPYALSRPIAIEAVEIDDPGQGEVLMQIVAAGLCHSDLSAINGDRPRPMPLVLGHEAAGIVKAVGPGVTEFAEGDHVVMVFMPNCGQCVRCSEGRPALCEKGAAANARGELITGSRRIHSGETVLHHHVGCSAFASHAVVSQSSLVKIDKDLPLKTAALFGCAVLTGVGAVVNTAEVAPGETVAIIGLGGVGLAALLGAIAAGASQVVAIDLSAEKLDLARRLGATLCINGAADDLVQQVKDATNGGVDKAIELAGSAVAMRNAIAMTRRGGTTVTAGLPPRDATVPVNIVDLVGAERTIKGSYMGSCVPRRDIPRYIALYRAGRLPVDALMSGELALEDINEAFDRLNDGQAVRQIINF